MLGRHKGKPRTVGPRRRRADAGGARLRCGVWRPRRRGADARQQRWPRGWRRAVAAERERDAPGGPRAEFDQGVPPVCRPLAQRAHLLQGAQQHNGKSATVHSYDGNSERYTVTLRDGGDALRIKHENLLQAVDGEVTGMQNRTEYNGRKAEVCDYDAGRGRYHVRLAGVGGMDSGTISLQPANLILPNGCRARVTGLVSQPQWNQRVGKVLDFDRVRGRYLVQMSRDDQLSIKLENLVL